MNKICITYTCLSDNEQLIENILWHKSIGVDLFIVFLDKDIHEFEAKYNGIANIIVKQSAAYIPRQNDPQWVVEAFNRKHEHYDFEKVLNVYSACEIAYNLHNCNWLISIDADELIYVPNNHKSNVVDSSIGLDYLISTLSSKYDQIIFECAELLPEANSSDATSFFGKKYFVVFPNRVALFIMRVLNRILILFGCKGNVVEIIVSVFLYMCGYNVRNKSEYFFSITKFKPYFLGYMGYKSAIKLPNYRNYIFSIHYWLNHWPQSSPKTAHKRYCLHYDIPNFQAYRKKSVYQTGKALRYQNRREIFDVGRNPDQEIAAKYFNSEIAVTEEQIERANAVITINVKTVDHF